MTVYKCDKCASETELVRVWFIKKVGDGTEVYFDLCNECVKVLQKVVAQNIML
jgi:hypothetical protein